MKPVLLTLASLCLFAGSMTAASPLQTQKVAIFKDGSAYFHKNGQLSTQDGAALLRNPGSDVLFGTFWVSSPGDNLRGLASYYEKKDTLLSQSSVHELIRSNVGRKVRITLRAQGTPPQTGPQLEYTGTLAHAGTEVATLQTAEGWQVIQLGQVDRLLFLDKPVTTRTSEDQELVLRFDFKSPHPTEQVDMYYVRQGMGWVPNYFLELKSDDRAMLGLHAQVFNQAEDVVNAEMDFVVGIPNFKNRAQREPLYSKMSFSEFMGVATNVTYQWNNGASQVLNFSNSLSNQAYAGAIHVEPAAPPSPLAGGELAPEGDNGEDLYFYKVRNVTLRKGGHGIYDIFRTEIPCKHLYETTLPANSMDWGYYQRQTHDDPALQEVFHSLELTNSTSYPWTTGTVMVISTGDKGDNPVSQDKLTYTPASGKVLIPLLKVPDISVQCSEQELSREENKKTFRKRKYHLLKVEGIVTLKNYKNKAVTVKLNRLVTGAPDDSNLAWDKHERTVNYSVQLNGYWDLSWKVDLKAGEEREVRYTYYVYLPV